MTKTKVLTVFNQAGGVGKTTITMNVGYQLSRRGHRVLLVDMDPQASLTVFMGLEPGELEMTVYDALLGEESLPILKNIHQMDMTPSNIDLSAAEMQLVSAIMRELRLKKALDPILDDYDFILIDSPPSLGILSVLTLVAATHVLVPIQTQYKSFKGTELLLDSMATVRANANKELRLAGVIPNIFAARTVQDESTLEALRQQMGSITTVYSPLPRSTAFADASKEHLPLANYNPRHPAVAILDEIAKGLEKLA